MAKNAKARGDALLNLPIKDKGWQLFWQEVLLPEFIQFEPPTPKKKILVLAGPTAVGKTALSLELARTIGGEIISADSMQVYRGLDIGTAKPSLAEREAIPHHLIDIRHVTEPFTVMDFWCEASKAIEEICARGHVPIVVGGTGFYLHALLYGPPTGPASVPSLRAALEEEMEKKGALALFYRLQELDPKYAATITSNDKHKIIRALEIISLTQKKVSSFAKQEGISRYNARCWFLERPRDILYKRIEARCDEMIKHGLLEEIESLDARGLRKNSSAALAIGYRQGLAFLDSARSADDFSQLVQAFKQVSRHYARRQFTWFKKEPLFRLLDLESISFDRALEIILQDFELSF